MGEAAATRVRSFKDTYLFYVFAGEKSLHPIIEPILFETTFLSHSRRGDSYLLRWYEYRVDVSGCQAGIVRHGHRGSTNDKKIGIDSHPSKLIIQ